MYSIEYSRIALFESNHEQNCTFFTYIILKTKRISTTCYEKYNLKSFYLKMFIKCLFIISSFHTVDSIFDFFLFQNASVILFGVRCTKTNLVQYCDISLQCTNAYAWKDAFVQLLQTSWNFQKQNIQMFFTNNPVSNKNWKYVKK